MKKAISVTIGSIIIMTVFGMDKIGDLQFDNARSCNHFQGRLHCFRHGLFLGSGKTHGRNSRVSLTWRAAMPADDRPDVGYEDVLAHEKMLRTGKTDARNHAEVVKVTFDPNRVSLKTVLEKFWENHDPTQGNRQGNDVGSNYRSAIYFNSEDQKSHGARHPARISESPD